MKSILMIAFMLFVMSTAGAAAKHDEDFPMCLGRTCDHGTCTSDWAGGKPLTVKGMRACCQYGGTAYLTEDKIFCRPGKVRRARR